MKDPACRVAPERGGPSRKRRPSPSSGTATKTPAHPRRPKSVEYHCNNIAAQRPNKNGTLARRDDDGRCGGKQSDDQAVAPTAQRCQSKRMRARRPHGKERGKSASGSAQKRRTLRSAQRGTECDFGKSRSLSHAPDRHPNGPRLQAWFAQRIERVARGAAPKKAYPILLAGISGPSHTRFSKSACFGSSSTNIPSTLRTLISSLVYSGNQ